MAFIWLVVLFFFGRQLLKVFQVLFQDAQFVRLLGLVGIILASGAHIYHRLEGWSYLDSFYFTIITLTTVGYGDFSPQTSLGKLFSMLYILLGLGVLGAFIAILSDKSHKWSATKEQSSRDEEHE
ncbi:potassium channel family protein [Chloroflexi bacterium TSY]|nr:potassium channel family protein [Chloroflexi bacterium TSY]